MKPAPDDLDASRAAVAADGLVAEASGYLTTEIAIHLPFEALGPYKTLLKQFFSSASWTADDAEALSSLVVAHVASGWWQHRLANGVELNHGIDTGAYLLHATGAATRPESIFDVAFDGPVVPEATPHPRKVKFNLGGTPAPGHWFRRGDDVGSDERVARLFEEPDVTDVMVAGDFITIGLNATASWEERLLPLLDLVTDAFSANEALTAPERTREELLHEAAGLHAAHTPEELHLLDPDDPDQRRRLLAALDDDDPRVRRIAVAILAESADRELAIGTATTAYRDPSRIVRRTAIDAAADTADPAARALFETALASDDAWIRWKAVRAIGDIGVDPSRALVADLGDDDDFQVRMEVAAVLSG